MASKDLHKMPPQITVAVSTMNGYLNQRNYPDGDYKILIINQGEPFGAPLPSRFIVINDSGKGLSRSRNLAIRHCPTRYMLLCDNDVRLLPRFEKHILVAIEKYPNSAAITFKVRTPDGGDFKSYRRDSFPHNKLTACKACSIEIVVDCEQIGSVRFDEQFGLGAAYPVGEENIFLSDLLSYRKSVIYCPEYICEHPEFSSGALLDKNAYFLRGKVFFRIFGKKGLVIGTLFWCKKEKFRLNSIPKLVAFFSSYLKGL